MPDYSSVGAGAASGAAAGSVFGPWGTVIGGVVGGAAGLLSKKAAKPVPYQNVDLTAEQRKALNANIGAESDIEALLARANAFNQDQSLSLMEKAMPGYSALAKRLTGLAGDLATNPYDLPADVQANISRQAAERGIQVGTRGQNQQFSLLRDLGINSLEYGQQRIGQAAGLTSLLAGLAPKVNPMSPMSFYVTPGMSAQISQSNNGINQEIAQSANNAETAATNANRQSLWDSLAFAAATYQKPKDKSGVGKATSYDDFVRENPFSGAAGMSAAGQ